MKKFRWSRIASYILLIFTILPEKKYTCHEKKTLVVLTFDDGYSCWRSTILPILKQYGLTATAFINDPDRVKTQTGHEIKWNDIRELYNAGWEIGWHTAEHIKVTVANPLDLVEDFSHSPALFKEHGLPPPVTFAYPCGLHNYASMATVSRFFLAGRTLHGGVNSPYYVQKHPEDLMAIDLFNAIPFTKIKEIIDKWRNKGIILIFNAHTVGQIAEWQSKPDMNTEEFQKLAEFLGDGRKRGDFNVVTLKEGVERMKQWQVTYAWSFRPDSLADWHVTHGGFSLPPRFYAWYQALSRFKQHQWPKR
jgi:peptidoglycan/xylan/chitin deacetylase (PgdA/CDA1 family)